MEVGLSERLTVEEGVKRFWEDFRGYPLNLGPRLTVVRVGFDTTLTTLDFQTDSFCPSIAHPHSFMYPLPLPASSVSPPLFIFTFVSPFDMDSRLGP